MHQHCWLCVLLCRNESVQLFLQSSDICDFVQQSHSDQPAGHAGACQVYSGYFHQLGQFCTTAFAAEFIFHCFLKAWLLLYSCSCSWAEYCDQHVSVLICLPVCMSVCKLAFLKNHVSKFYEIFPTCYLCLWIGPPLMSVQCIMYFQFCGWRHVYTSWCVENLLFHIAYATVSSAAALLLLLYQLLSQNCDVCHYVCSRWYWHYISFHFILLFLFFSMFYFL